MADCNNCQKLQGAADRACKILDPDDQWPEMPVYVRAQRAVAQLEGLRTIAENATEKVRAEAALAQSSLRAELAKAQEKLASEQAATARLTQELEEARHEGLEATARALQAEADAQQLEGMAEATTRAFVEAFSADAADDLRKAVNALRLEVDPGIMEDVELRVQRMLHQLSLLLGFVRVQRISSEDEEPRFSACIPSIAGAPGGYANTPDEAIGFLATALQGKLDDRATLLRSEHGFRAALRHVQTEMVDVDLAFRAIRNAVGTALDDENGKPRGFFENMPPKEDDK
jgi:hypothetical protein